MEETTFTYHSRSVGVIWTPLHTVFKYDIFLEEPQTAGNRFPSWKKVFYGYWQIKAWNDNILGYVVRFYRPPDKRGDYH